MRLYHVSPADRAASIAEHGLEPAKGLDTPGQVWFYTDEQRARAHAGGRSVVWTVEGDLLDLRWDTPWGDAACYTRERVSPDLLTLLEGNH